MEREFLTGLGLEEQTVQAILEAAEEDAAGWQKALDAQAFDAAVEKAVGGVRFSSKAAERDFAAQLREKQWEVKDGTLVGFEQFLQERRDAEPEAFFSGQPVPRFVAPVGIGGPVRETANIAQAREIGAERAAALRASGEVLKYFL